jgi:lipopolysaccharide/colanic/teichoic acid biosynthesis glycosyltransferase
MVSLNESPIAGFHLFVKRLSDIVIATFALIIFAPLMLTIALLIKLTSRGPIFYRQERMSLNGRHFHMLKFRSMTIDQAGDIELLTKANDPRVTKIGRFIRRTSLDELPQLINVFLGDMSIVGPSP